MIASQYFGHPRLHRNLGNQLFELASLIGLARRYDTSLYLPNRWHYAADFKLSPSIGVDPPASYITLEEPGFHCCLDFFDRLAPLIQNERVNIEGYLQSEKYWKPVEKEIREIFTFQDHRSDAARLFLQEHRIDIEKTVAISVRRGDFATDPHHYLLPAEYYRGALVKYFPGKDILFFSDDPEWCRKTFRYNDRRVSFSENKSATEQLALMSLFKYFIIANSTFSWWGAYLSGEKGKVVVRPFHHFDGTLKETADLKDHYPLGWIEYNYEQE